MKALTVRQLQLAGFSPSKRSLERGDVEPIVGKCRTFLTGALKAGEDELPVVELE